MDWAEKVFVRNARLYELVLEGMWERGEEDAVAISSLLSERGFGGCRVLDVPCGIGRVAIPLARLGFDLTGVDISPYLVGAAKRRAKSEAGAGRAKFVVGNMLDLTSRFEEARFDVVLNVFTSIGYGSEEEDLKFFREARDVTRKGGALVISGLRNRDYIARNPSQNVYEESKRLLVLDTYAFDEGRSREKGLWRLYLKAARAGGELLKFAGEFPIDIRVYSPHELVPRLEATGWSVQGTYDSFTTRGQAVPESPVYAVFARAV